MELGQKKVYYKYFKVDSTYKGVKIKLFYYYNIGWKQKNFNIFAAISAAGKVFPPIFIY